MFGLVTASLSELEAAEKSRYEAVYCGICRSIRRQDGQLCRLGLSFDMVFLALLLMSLYEPQEQTGVQSCVAHPLGKRPWVENEYVDYAARMNVALACYKARDDWQDDQKQSARMLARLFGRHEAQIRQEFPRQCQAMEDCIRELSRLERSNSPDADGCASCFGRLMAELLVVREDVWSPYLRRTGFCLGRFIYLADAAMDYREDLAKHKYNPFLAMGTGEDEARWEDYLVLAMAGCTDAYERLPLVQDKKILDNILYSGVWLNYRRKQRENGKEQHDGRSL